MSLANKTDLDLLIELLDLTFGWPTFPSINFRNPDAEGFEWRLRTMRLGTNIQFVFTASTLPDECRPVPIPIAINTIVTHLIDLVAKYGYTFECGLAPDGEMLYTVRKKTPLLKKNVCYQSRRLLEPLNKALIDIRTSLQETPYASN